MTTLAGIGIHRAPLQTWLKAMRSGAMASTYRLPGERPARRTPPAVMLLLEDAPSVSARTSKKAPVPFFSLDSVVDSGVYTLSISPLEERRS